MEKKHIPVNGHPGLVRDAKSGAILNINKTEIQKARERHARQQTQLDEYEELKSDVSQLKNDIGDIKDLLTKLVDKK
tara:strand:- start:1611 stop:1841 length:231 start_codon:yes stop_codon:yes gene_type:complete